MAVELFNLGSNGVTTSAGYEEDGQIILVDQMPGKNVQRMLSDFHNTAGIDQKGIGMIGASIPVTVRHRWKTEWTNTAKAYGIPWQFFLKRKLNDPAYKKFVNMSF